MSHLLPYKVQETKLHVKRTFATRQTIDTFLLFVECVCMAASHACNW